MESTFSRIFKMRSEMSPEDRKRLKENKKQLQLKERDEFFSKQASEQRKPTSKTLKE